MSGNGRLREPIRPLPNFCMCGNLMLLKRISGNIMVYSVCKALYEWAATKGVGG